MGLPEDAEELALTREHLLSWFDDHKRDLPWRHEPHRSDPYAVLVSEIMLQQTQVDTVVPYFEAWLDRWPTVEALAEASEDEVLHAWQGLGYYNRARRLHRAARQIVEAFDGQIPRTVDGLQALPGVGPYTAAAVAAFAYDQAKVPVDGNVARVWARLEAQAVDPTKVATKRRARQALQGLVDGARPGETAEALMELGARVCTPRRPDCVACPLDTRCTALIEERVHEVPLTADRPDQPTKVVVALLVETEEGVLLRRRPADGLLGGLWGLPMVERDPGESLDAAAQRCLGGLPVQRDEQAQAVVAHTFTHKRWQVRVYQAQVLDRLPTGEAWTRCKPGQTGELALSTLDRKVLDALAQTTLERFA